MPPASCPPGPCRGPPPPCPAPRAPPPSSPKERSVAVQLTASSSSSAEYGDRIMFCSVKRLCSTAAFNSTVSEQRRGEERRGVGPTRVPLPVCVPGACPALTVPWLGGAGIHPPESLLCSAGAPPAPGHPPTDWAGNIIPDLTCWRTQPLTQPRELPLVQNTAAGGPGLPLREHYTRCTQHAGLASNLWSPTRPGAVHR